MISRASWIRIALVALALVALLAPTAALGKKKHKRSGPEGEQPARDRPPRGRGLPARAHARGLHARDQARRRLHRAGPRGHEGRRADRPPRAEHHRHDGRGHHRSSRRKTHGVSIDGGPPEDGWFASDFTLAEIKTLRAKQPFAERPQQFNGKFKIPTFQEVIDLVKRESRKRGRKIGIYPETKHPTYHRPRAAARGAGSWTRSSGTGSTSRSSPVFIQSFEQSNLQAAEPHDAGAAGAARGRQRHNPAAADLRARRSTGRTTGPSRATRAPGGPSATSRPTPASRRSRPTPTASGRGRCTSSARSTTRS